MFRSPPRLNLGDRPVAPISPATLELMRKNLAARAEQHAAIGDDHGAEVYRRLADELQLRKRGELELEYDATGELVVRVPQPKVKP